MKFEHECSRCGMCCITEPCPIALQLGLAEPNQSPCPVLHWNGDESFCEVVTTCDEDEIKEHFGIGKGCCMKATVVRSGKFVDFASLPKEEKIRIVNLIKEGGIGCLRKSQV